MKQRAHTDPHTGEAGEEVDACGIPFAETLGAAEIAFVDTQATDPPLCFPDLNGREDQRMEDLVASRLFPNRSSAERIGRYMLLDRLGQGGMGVVYSAYDAELERKVAIKLLRPGQLTRNAEPRLRREAQAMAKVVHANVVSVIEVGTHDEVTYVVMEHIRGHSLAHWCQEERSWRETLGVFVQAGRGLAAAHRAGVIHRDFKMHNAMIIGEGPDAGRVKVLDFGLARAVDNEEPTPADARLVSDELANRFAVRLTASGAVMGTPAYMAPEQITRGHASERSDQYNFAASLYEALYGELPFTGTSPGALIRAVLDDPLPPPRPNADVPGWVYRIVAQGLARDPADRFPGMDVLCDALERDPSAKRRNLAFALGAILLVGAGSWSLGTLSSESPCTGPDFELTETWDLARAQAVQHAFGAAGVTYADDAASRAIGLLDDYAEHWSEARGEACEAHRRGVESQQLLDLRMACLGRRRASFASLAELLVDADAQVVERAVEAAHNLPPIVMCRGETLLSAIALPEDRTIAKQVNEAREQLAATVAIANAGRHDRAHEQLDALRARTESLGFLPLTAEIELARGTVALEQRRASSAEHALTTALDAALEAGADQLAAEALARRIFVRGVLLGNHAGARADAELTRPLAQRFDDNKHLHWLYLNNVGTIETSSQENARARELLSAAAQLREGPSPVERAWTFANLSLNARAERDLIGALAPIRQAVEVVTTELGPKHPLVDTFRTREAAALVDLGRHREARSLLDQVLLNLEVRGGPVYLSIVARMQLARIEHRHRRDKRARDLNREVLTLADPSDYGTVAEAELGLAFSLAGLGEFPAARRHRDTAISIVDEHFEPTDELALTILMTAAEQPAALGDVERSVGLLRRSMRNCCGEDRASLAVNQRLLADALLLADEPDEALELAEAASATLRGLTGDNTLDLAAAELSRGRALIATGAPEAGTAALDNAVTYFEDWVDPDDPTLAAARVELARALRGSAPSDPKIAELLGLADAAYLELGPAFTQERNAINGLLGDLR